MHKQIKKYTVVIEKQKRTGTNEVCFSAFVPSLGIATEADTSDQVEKEIQALVQFHLETLAKEGEEIPFELEPSIIKRFQAVIPEDAHLAS